MNSGSNMTLFTLHPVKKTNLNTEDSLKKDKENDADTYKIEIRVPPLYPDKPALWFAMMEAQFNIANIKTDDMKYYFVVGYLDQEYAYMVEDIICSPPAEKKYEKLKSELIKRIAQSQEEKLKDRLMEEEMDDKKPSEFFRHLRKLAGPEVSEQLLIEIWLNQLPGDLQKFMKMVIKPNGRHYTLIADAFVKNNFVRNECECESDQPEPSLNELNQQIEELTNQVELLNTKVDRMSQMQVRLQLERTRSKSPERIVAKPQPQPEPPSLPHCWYHSTFGNDAERCEQPCNFKAKDKH